jgi:outer membrane murein-binding lipoprotein Lpp
MRHIVKVIINIMSKVNEIVSKYAEKLKSFGVSLSAVEEAVEQKQMAMAVLADGTEVYSPDAEFGMGSELFVMDADGNPTPVADGEYETAEGKLLVVVSGKINEIKDQPMEQMPMEETCAPVKEEQASFDGVSKEEFESTINNLISAFEAKINELSAEKQELSATIEKMSKAPATESVKKTSPVAQKQSAEPTPFRAMDTRSRAYQLINSKK